jgi:hypothetical protein
MTGGKPDPKSTIVVEAYDARAIAVGRAARLRWSAAGKDLPTQVAVGPRGVYFLDARADDAAVAAAFGREPTAADPPAPLDASPESGWRFVTIENGVACVGKARPESSGCQENCFGELCVSPASGVVSITGTTSPDGTEWSATP